MNLDFIFPINQMECRRMERLMSIQKESIPRCFAWDSRDSEKDFFIDLYIWDDKLTNKFQRFVLSTKTYLEDSEEKLLRYYTTEVFTEMYVVDYRILYEQVQRAYPDIKLKYHELIPMQTILHIYFATHYAYPEEKFYKSGLDNLGMYLSSFQDIQQDGKSPQKILGVPIKLLRNMNSSKVAREILKTKERREALSDLYYNYQGIFADVNGSLSDGQCMFLEILVDQLIEEEKIYISDARTIMRRLEYCYSKERVERLWYYCCLRQELKVLGIDIPVFGGSEEYLDLINDKLKHIIRYKKDEQFINIQLEAIRTENKQDEYENQKYRVHFPYSLNNVLETGEILSNCLYTYVDRLCNREKTVMFVIERKRNIPVAALEINLEKRKIYIALGKKNFDVEEDVEKFLEEFAKEKGFKKRECIEGDEGIIDDNYEYELEEMELFGLI